MKQVNLKLIGVFLGFIFAAQPAFAFSSQDGVRERGGILANKTGQAFEARIKAVIVANGYQV